MHRKHIPQLDGLRGFAVLLVLLAHSANAFTRVDTFRWIDRYGSLGVQLFFVLSGFLITQILLASKSSDHFLRNFLVRRGLRIYPLYYALLAFVVFSGVVHQHGVHWWVYGFYVSNLIKGSAVQPAPLAPVWSLAVEEQFYLIWPLVVSAISRRRLEQLCFFIVVTAICLRFTGLLQLHNTLLQLDALAAGALIACRVEKIDSWRSPARLVACLLPLGMALPAGFANNVSQTVQVLSGAALLIVLLDAHSPISALFRLRSLRYLGKVSYGTYLLHSLVFAAFLRSRTELSVIESGSAPKAICCIAAEFLLVLTLATASFYAFERPFLALKRFFEPRAAAGPETNVNDQIDLKSLVTAKAIQS